MEGVTEEQEARGRDVLGPGTGRRDPGRRDPGRRRRGGVCGPLMAAALVALVVTVCMVLWRPFAAVPRPVPSARATLGVAVAEGTYAFMRAGQIDLAGTMGAPRQLTAFAHPDRDPTHWGPIVWAPDNRHVAVAVGDPLVSRDNLGVATGVLYVVDMRSGDARVVAPAKPGAVGVAVGPGAYAWRDGGALVFVAGGGVYAYALAGGLVTAFTGLTGSAVEVEVRGGALYYSSAALPDGPLLTLSTTLRRHDFASGHDSIVVGLGLGRFEVTGCNAVGCQAAPGVPAAVPAWDVAADGSAVAYETVTGIAPDDTSLTASFWYAALANGALSGTPARVFAAVRATLPADTPGACCFLRFAPDGRGLVLSSGYAMAAGFGPYLTYANPPGSAVQVGAPWAFGPAAWTPDARGFTLVAHQRAAANTALLNFGDQDTAILQADASDCAWAWVAE